MTTPPAALRGTLHLGDFHPDLESAFAACLRELAPGGDARKLLVLTPNRLLGVHLRRRAAQLGVGTFGLRPRALEDLTTELAAPVLKARGLRALEGWELPLLASEILGRSIAGSAPYFANSAARPGLFRALAGTFRDLRDAAVEPEALAEAAAGISPKLEQVAELYRRFVAGLLARKLADAAAVGEAAVEAVVGAPALPDTVLAYGFYELVGRQRSLLGALLAGRRAEVFFPWGDNPAFAYAAPLRDWFLEQGLVARNAAAADALPALPADLAALRRGLFAEPGAAKRAARARDRSVRFVSAPTAAREAVEVLRRLVEAPSRSAAVLLRHPDEDSALWSGARRATGVPVHLRAGNPWLRRPAGRAAHLLLGLAAGRRPATGGEATLARSEVEDLLATGALAPELFARGSHPERWTQILRRRGLIGGLGGWERLRDLAARPAPAAARAGDDEERDPLLRRELPALGAFVVRLLEDTALLAGEAQSWTAWWQRLRAVLERWLAAGGERDGVLAALRPLERLDGVVKFDWNAALASAEGLLGAPGPAAPDADAEERFGSAPTIAALATLRGLTFERVVVPALVERSFPRRGVQDAILLDRERDALNVRLGTGAIPRKLAGVAAEERFLFRLAIGAARQEVVLSWPRHAADGRRVVPSSFALAAGRALLGREVMFADLERHAGRDAGQSGDGGPLGLEHAPLSPVEAARVRKGGDRRRLTPLLPWEFDFAEIARVDAAAHRAAVTPELSYLLDVHPGLGPTLDAQRGRRGAGTAHRLTAWDGLVGPELAAAWWERNRTESGAFRVSPSALELYALCSFKFFHEKVLGLQSEPAPERRLDLDQRDVGALVHRILDRLYERLEKDRLLPLGPAKLEDARAAVGPVLDAVVAEDPALIAGAPPALWKVRRRRLIEDLEHLVEREAEAGQGWRPLQRELAFGVRGQPPVEITVAGERLALRGRLDRLDIKTPAGDGGRQSSAADGGKQSSAAGGGGARLRVIDYKTGKLDPKQTPEPPGLLGGRKLQLPLYRLAAAALTDREPASIEAAYLGVERLSGFREVSWYTEHFDSAAPRFETIVGAILRGVRAGEFFQIERDIHCDEQCAFKEICGPGRMALIEAKRIDQRVTAAELWRVDGEGS